MKRHAPAAERNRGPIEGVLREVLPESGRVLEIASGTGQHAVHFAGAFPGLRWQPTDPDPAALESIEGWRAEAKLDNVLPPLQLDVRNLPWPVEAVDAVVCINMIHIAPWSACEALLEGAASVLSPGAPLILYGPFFRAGVPTAPSNVAFDHQLRARDPEWGVRRLEDVAAAAAKRGFGAPRVVELPANNCAVIFARSPAF